MAKFLGDNSNLMYLTQNEGMSVVAERFIRTLESKIYKKMTTNNSKSCHGYLNELVDGCNNTYHNYIDKNLLILNILPKIEEIKSGHKAPKF